MTTPTSDVLRDQQIADEIAAQDALSLAGGEYMQTPDVEAMSERIFTDLRGGTVAIAPDPIGDTGRAIRSGAGAVAGAVGGTVHAFGEGVANVAAGLASGLRTGAILAVLGLVSLAVLAVRR